MPARNTQYSSLILDEAVALAADTTLKNAAAVTGVNKESIRHHARLKRIAANKLNKPKSKEKYPMAKKIECIKLAMQYKAEHGQRKAFILAGNQLGLGPSAGRSIEFQYVRGLIPGYQP